MNRLITFVLMACISISLSAQFYDNHWMMGYSGGDATPPNDSFGVSILSFYEAELQVTNNQEIDLFFGGAGSALSDYNGDLVLFSNNLEIRDANDQQIINGVFENNDITERNLPQSFVYLPFELMYLVQYVQMGYTDTSPPVGQNLYSSLISSVEPIAIYSQLENIISDSITTGELTACRHANGRDWWVLVAAYNKPVIYSVLFNPSGVYLIDSLEVDFIQQSGLGQAVFSPDGNFYARYNNALIGEPDYLDVFEFDRCSGQVSNHRHTTIESVGSSGGVAISPSSQYLYVSHYDYIYQYDLWANDVFSTQDTVAIYDGYLEWNIFNGRFYQAQLAPDGKIYLNSPSGIKKLHVIDSPDEPGLACDVRQHSIQLPNNNVTTLANHPNYRLGPIDGSPCDTLGIDNLPRAYYRIDRNNEDTLQFHFQDLSFYEPEDWFWTFGDNSSSIDRHPDHTYATPGIYEVCLTVSNDLGSDTNCRTLELGPVAVDDPQQLEFTTFPNPVQNVLIFDLGDYFPLNGRFILYDAVGQEIMSEQVLYKQARFELTSLPAGTYFYEFWDGGRQLGQGKVMRAAN